MYKRTHPSGVVEENVYDGNSGLLEKVKASTTVVWDIDAMNEYGQITNAKYGTNLTATMNYDMGLPDNAAIGNIYSYDYEFDPKFGRPDYRKNMKHGILTENFRYENLRLDSIWGSTSNGFAYESYGNIIRKNDLGLMEYDGYQVTDLYAKEANLVPTGQQDVTYTWFQQVEEITEGDYAATFTYNSDQQRCKMVVSQNGNTLYTRWYPGSRYMKEVKGSTTTQYTWLGGDAYSAPAVSVKTGTATPVIYYVLRDHLGSITHAVKASDLTYKEYSFDAWGRRRSANDWDYTLDTNDKELFAGRGFTEHEHLPEFNLINMNGRLYDPLLGRFLSPDNYVQMPDFSQNYNRYSYVLNNPLKYTDPDGEIIFTLLAALIPGAQPLLPYAIAADIGWMTDYGMQVAMNYANKQEGLTGKDIWFKQIDWFDVGMSAVVSGVTGGFGAELKAGKELGKFGSWVVKNSKLIYAGEIIATSAIDITGEGWQKVGMDDFGKRVAVGLTIYGINDIVGDYTKRYANVPESGIEAANGVNVKGFAGHGVHRAIGDYNRMGVAPEDILDAIKNPLKINPIVTDSFGRQSQRFIGRFGEVVINPITGIIIPVNPTSTNKAIKLLNQLGK